MRTRPITIILTLALIGGACSPDAVPETTTAPPTTTTTAPTTTTTIDEAAAAADTCTALKVAAFDLDSAITSGLQGLDIATESDFSDAEVGELVVEGMVAFYDELAVLSADAPAEVAEPLDTVAAAVDPWRAALESGGDDLEQVLEELDPASMDSPELDAAVAAIDAWTRDVCGTAVPVDVEEIIFTTVFAAMFGALGSVVQGLDDDFADLPGSESVNTDALVFGDDPRLDDLYTACGSGAGQACRDLYFSAYGEYELWGQTCGAAIPLRPAFVVDCDGKFSTDVAGYGDDFVLDSLWDDCQAGDRSACDGLFAAAPVGSAYEQFGASCAGTREGDFTVPCGFVESGEPFGYGDDPAFDLLWSSCAAGDGVACDDLFFQTPIGSAYEAFGRVCSDLTEVAQSCENAAAWLGGPTA